MIQSKSVVHFGSISFSDIEVRDIVKAWLAISLAFAFVMTEGINFSLIPAFVISALTVGVGFIAHELGHKFLAQKYGAWAEFRAWNSMLLFAILLAVLLNVVFAAPGAVMIFGKTIGKSRYGKIAAAGPIMNFIIALLFFSLMIWFPDGIIGTIGKYGFMVNTWLGLFNLIPFGMFDGRKIFIWNKSIYTVLAVAGFTLISIGYILVSF